MNTKQTELTTTDSQTRRQFADKLAHYAKKDPKQFLQMDGFYLPNGGDDSMRPDDEGDCLHASTTVELMYGATVRVLIGPAADRMVAIRQLQKLATWLKKDADLMKFVKPKEPADRTYDDSDIPF